MNAIFKKCLGVPFVFSLTLLLFSGCSKEEATPGTASLDVFFKSSFGPEKSTAGIQEVNLDIQQVFYHASMGSSGSGGWFEMETNAGVIDLLKDSMEKDTLLAFDPVMHAQTISQIRLVLGDQNTVKVDGETHDLQTPSGQTSGIKVQVHALLEAGKNYRIQLDFDVYRSVLQTGNGKYKLIPVINATVIEEEGPGHVQDLSVSSPETGGD